MRALKHVSFFLFSIVWLMPLVLVFVASFLPSRDIENARFFEVNNLTMENFIEVFSRPDSTSFLLNSLVVSVIAAFVGTTLGLLGAWYYRLRNFSFTGFFGFIVGSRILPATSILLPLYIYFSIIGIGDSLIMLGIILGIFNLPIAMWLLHSQMRRLPREIFEESALDLRSDILELLWVGVPLVARPTIGVAMAIFLLAWNEYLVPLMLIGSSGNKTWSIFLGDFTTAYAVEWGPLFAAASIMISVPIILVGIAYMGYRSSQRRRGEI